MIIVVGRPGLDENGELDRLSGRVAQAAALAGGRIELVGSVGADRAGDELVIALGRIGVGHAAVLRDPAGETPKAGATARLPRLDASDLELGLAYLPECRVLILAETLDVAARAVAAAAASYHGAAMIALVPAAETAPSDLPTSATVLAAPDADEGAFASLVGRYAVALATGRDPTEAWADALAGSGWEAAPA